MYGACFRVADEAVTLFGFDDGVRFIVLLVVAGVLLLVVGRSDDNRSDGMVFFRAGVLWYDSNEAFFLAEGVRVR